MSQPTGCKLADLAASIGATIRGDADRLVDGIAPLDTAGPGDVSFLSNPRYLDEARRTRAGAVIVGPGVELPGVTLLIVPDPYLALAEVLEMFHPARRPAGGVSPNAVIGESCEMGKDVVVGPGAVVGDRCRLGARSVVMPGAVLGAGVTVGEDTTIHPNVTVYDNCVLGSRVVIHAGSVIGSDGFGFARDGRRHRKIPQIGNVVVEDDVEIGAGVTVDRATFGSTVIGKGTKIDNLVQIGHNVQIGENGLLVAQSGISGSTRLGDDVTFAGQSGAVGHLRIGDGAVVGAKSAVTRNLEPGEFVIGHPAITAAAWKRAVALFARLPELRRRLLRLERDRAREQPPGSRNRKER